MWPQPVRPGNAARGRAHLRAVAAGTAPARLPPSRAVRGRGREPVGGTPREVRDHFGVETRRHLGRRSVSPGETIRPEGASWGETSAPPEEALAGDRTRPPPAPPAPPPARSARFLSSRRRLHGSRPRRARRRRPRLGTARSARFSHHPRHRVPPRLGRTRFFHAPPRVEKDDPPTRSDRKYHLRPLPRRVTAPGWPEPGQPRGTRLQGTAAGSQPHRTKIRSPSGEAR